jgi:hypothetical protein
VPLLLAIFVAASHGAADSYNTTMCVREPYKCGDVNISYPFYSKTGALPGNDDGSYCGYPGLQIQCEDDRALLQLGSGNYTVKHIDYEPPRISLALRVLGEESCPSVDGNVTLRNGSWLDYPKDTVDYLLFFISCKFVTITDDIRPSNTSSTNCKFGDKAAYGLYFVFRKEDVPYPNTNWWKECEKVVEVPVLNSSLPSDPRNYDTGWRNGGYGKTLRDGFELTWGQESKPQACSQCEQSSGLCGYIQTGVYVSCLCSGGRVGAPNCTSIAASGKPSLQAFPNLQRGLEVILVPLCLACAMNSNRFRLSWYSHGTSWTESNVTFSSGPGPPDSWAFLPFLVPIGPEFFLRFKVQGLNISI